MRSAFGVWRLAFGVRRWACVAGCLSLRRKIRSNSGFAITRTKTDSHMLSFLMHDYQYRRTPNAKRISLTRPSIRAPLSC